MTRRLMSDYENSQYDFDEDLPVSARQPQPQPQQQSAPAPQESENQYAHMFADWDLLPPQMVIRRINRKI